jgi:hypothetical protein
MKRENKGIQYTIRSVPKELDRILRNQARKEGRSLNEVALDALHKGTDLSGIPIHPELHQFFGVWVDDPEFEKALEDQRRIDPELWR